MKILSNEKLDYLRNISYKDGFAEGRDLRNYELADELLKIACQVRRVDTWDKELKNNLIDRLITQYRKLAK